MQIYSYDKKYYLLVENNKNQFVFFEKDYAVNQHPKWAYVDLQNQNPEIALLILIGGAEECFDDNKKDLASTFYAQAKKELSQFAKDRHTQNPNIKQYYECKKAMQHLPKDIMLSDLLDFQNFETAWENAFNERFYPKTGDKDMSK